MRGISFEIRAIPIAERRIRCQSLASISAESFMDFSLGTEAGGPLAAWQSNAFIRFLEDRGSVTYRRNDAVSIPTLLVEQRTRHAPETASRHRVAVVTQPTKRSVDGVLRHRPRCRAQ